MTAETIHICLIVANIIAMCYVVTIGAFTIGLMLLRQAGGGTDNADGKNPKVSVLVAARNEEKNIERLINSLNRQTYPAEKTEIIIIDDHSDDKTFTKAEETCKALVMNNITIVHANDFGKKAAISQALHLATGDLVVVTDADSRHTKEWISTIAGFYSRKKPKMILGPVVLNPATTLFEKLQVLEHLSLMGSTAGSAAIHMPVMSNGANMAYERLAALQADAERDDKKVASGDDVFLMAWFTKHFGGASVQFLSDENAIVETEPAHSIKEFVSQRTRWVSKAKNYKTPSIIACALVVGLFCLTILGMFVTAFFEPVFWPILVLFILLKTLVDLPLLRFTARFLKKEKLLIWVFPLEIIYPFYVVFTAAVGLLSKPVWKGRKI